MGAIYWSLSSATPEWIARYPDLVKQYHVVEGGSLPGLAVPAGDLSFSVSVFVGCALCCLRADRRHVQLRVRWVQRPACRQR